MYDLQLVSSVFVLTINIVCCIMLWVFRGNSKPKTILAVVATVVACWNLFAVLLMTELRFDRLDFFYEMVGITMVSLVHIYIRYLMEPGPDIKKESRKLVILLAVYFCVYFIIRLFEPRIVLHDYKDILTNIKHPEVWLRIILAVNYLLLYIRFILGVIRMYPRHKRRIASLYSYREQISLSWVPFVAILYIIYGLASTIDIFFAEPNSVQLIIFNLFFAVFYLIVFFIGAVQQDVYTAEDILQIESDEEQVSKQLVVPGNIREKLKKELLRLMEEEKIYSDPNLRLDTVAEKLNTNRTYLSNIINDDYGKSFIVFINEFRVKEAQRMMIEQANDMSITEISELAGFKSHSSFIEFFKRFTGMKPSEYRRRFGV